MCTFVNINISKYHFLQEISRIIQKKSLEENRTDIHVQLTLRLHLEWPWSCKADGMLIWLDCWSNASEAPITPTFGKLWGGHDRSKNSGGLGKYSCIQYLIGSPTQVSVLYSFLLIPISFMLISTCAESIIKVQSNHHSLQENVKQRHYNMQLQTYFVSPIRLMDEAILTKLDCF